MHKISYTANGVTSEYVFAFPFFNNADVRVSVNGTLLDYTQYGVWPNEDFTGGTVIFPTPPDKNSEIDIFRQISLKRVIDYQPTAKIDPENLNSDFNFLLEAFRDLHSIDASVTEWSNIHEKTLAFLKYTRDVVEDKLGGGSVLGLYNNLLSVLSGALPLLINDYGSVSDPAPNETADDYGVL